MKCCVMAMVSFLCLVTTCCAGEGGDGGLLVPEGVSAARDAVAEAYTNTGWASEIVHDATGMEMVFVPAGEFEMGSPDSEPGHTKDESPMRKVRISKPFYIGKYEVTQAQWVKVMGANPSGFAGDKHPLERPGGRKRARPKELTEEDRDLRPVERVSWPECVDFLNKAGAGLRLPTEAEWEYACRAGTKTAYASGDALSTDDANFNGKEAQWEKTALGENRDGTIPVGLLPANAWGIHDMHGNVYEWCQDVYLTDSYVTGGCEDPVATGEKSYKVVRGGCWGSYAAACRSAKRYYMGASEHNFGLGLRAAVNAVKTAP